MSNTLSDEVKAFLNEPRFAVLATQHANGTIQQTVMWYELRDNVIMMNTLAGRVKDGNLRRSPNASICVENGYQFVTINGTVDFDEDVQTARDDIYALARRYNPDFKDGDYPDFANQQRVTLNMSIDHVITNGFGGGH